MTIFYSFFFFVSFFFKELAVNFIFLFKMGKLSWRKQMLGFDYFEFHFVFGSIWVLEYLVGAWGWRVHV